MRFYNRDGASRPLKFTCLNQHLLLSPESGCSRVTFVQSSTTEGFGPALGGSFLKSLDDFRLMDFLFNRQTNA